MGVSIITLLSALIVILFLAAIFPALNLAVAQLTNSTAGDPVATAVAGLIPLVIIIAIFIGIFADAQPVQQYY